MADSITVSELSRQIKQHLEPRFANVAVTGEISNYRGVHHSGHVYCNLKDDGAQIRLIIWGSTLSRQRFELKDGLEVTITGKLDVYARRGEYSLVATTVTPKGTGALQLAFQQMHDRLQAEGLFDAARKRNLPQYPRRIGVVTSPTGAAVRDIITTACRRNRNVELFIVPVKVQGEGAALEIAKALRWLNAVNDHLALDLIIAGRGGGSLEDLWAFNEEPVARAIFESAIPVISAVGHEVDVTIADLVADLRAPTPTAAAEIAVPELAVMEEACAEFDLRLHRALRHTAEVWRGRLDTLASRLAGVGPLNLLRREQQRLDYLWEGLTRQVKHRVQSGNELVASLAARLEGLSPVAVLQRGYSITFDDTGKVLRDASQAKAGQRIRTRLGKGEFNSRVEGPVS
ncbi:MAG: exodeoxyribonuclease VII large subunit [Planctomycetes bacterium]|nr:exodeoxyribonuclease VII large subunit [Planctomycetota bacterium]